MIQMRKTIYCEIDFVESLLKRMDRKYDPWDDDWVEGDYARKILVELMSYEYIIVYFDDETKFRKLYMDNERFRKMVDKSEMSEGYAQLTCGQYIPLNSKDSPLNAVYFSMAEDEIAAQKGIMVLTPTTINNPSLYKDSGSGGIKKGKPFSWDKLLKNAQHCCNALIAVDNYLYKGRQNNLFPILNSLLPQRLQEGISFQLSLFMLEEPGRNIETIYSQIMEYLTNVRPALVVDLTIYKCYKTEFHDRAIITNNMWIECVGGFDLLKNDKYGFRTVSSKTTKTHLTFPFIVKDGSTDSYSLLLEDVENVRKIEREFKGSDKNRLFY